MRSRNPVFFASAAFGVLAAPGALGACDRNVPPECSPPSGPAVADVSGFHGGREKLGLNDRESVLTPAAVASPRFGRLWSSTPFAPATIDGREYAAHTYASPLYLHDIAVAGAHRDALIVGTSSGDVYAIAASGTRSGDRCVSGAVLWRTHVVSPSVAPGLDGGVPIGVLSTPIVDRDAHPPRVYAAALDANAGWMAFALELATGQVLPGWPVHLDATSIEAANANGPATFHDPREMSQRSALALSPSGDRLYVTFGSFRFASVGWLVALDPNAAKITKTFSSAPFSEPTSNGGIWGSGGPAIDESGDVWVATGNGPPGSADSPRTWANSLLRFSRDLDLRASYTPFNYCKLDDNNIDLAASAPLLLPNLDPARTTTPHLIACGGKQGNVYLLDRDHLDTGRDRRPSCSHDPMTDRSLHPPGIQPQFGAPGPLNVFGPYTDDLGEVDYAKMRSRPSLYRDGAGNPFLFVSGSTKAAADSVVNVPPGLARLRLVLEPGQPAYLRIDGLAKNVVFVNPGSPVVTSDGGNGPIVWVVDENAPRSASLLDPTTPHPVLYAIDGQSLEVLYRSPANLLSLGGKYVTPVIARGVAFVATDRLDAFGVAP